MKVFNTLTRQKEEFVPREPGKVTVYTCGPTVYRFIHIGNLRAFLMADTLRRAFTAQGLEVLHVKNITDVGHMRQEQAERGGDKMVLAALAEGKTLAQIAQFYTEAFHQDEERMNVLPAHHYPRATDHVQEMVALTERLVERGLAYEVEGNVYFDVEKFADYGKLSGNQMDTLLEGVRVEGDPLKRNHVDFTLWKAAEEGREVAWDSPWGKGFPGWHIECSAMSLKYLGERFDLHTGGVDNIFPHHEGEIAQSEGALGHPVVNYWVHCQHLLADGLKMAKSTGNSYTLAEIEQRGFEPMAFRYLCLTTHYRRRMNFSFRSLIAAQSALERLRRSVADWVRVGSPNGQPSAEADAWRQRFWEEIDDDIGTPRALAVLWRMAESDLPSAQKLDLIKGFDQVLGLNLVEDAQRQLQVPDWVARRVEERESLRRQGTYEEADSIRAELYEAQYKLEDTREGTLVRPVEATDSEKIRILAHALSDSKSVSSRLDRPPEKDLSVIILAHDYLEDVQRVVSSALQWVSAWDAEVIVVDNGTASGLSQWLERLREQDARLRVLHADHPLGEGVGKNVALKQATGRYVVILDISIGVDGDAFSPAIEALQDPSVGIVGPFGLRSYDLRHFDEAQVAEPTEMDAMQAYFIAFRRDDLSKTGLLDEKFRFYRNLDIDMSLQFKAQGLRVLALPGLPITRYEHKLFTSLSEEEVAKQSRKNFNRILRKWEDQAPNLVLHYDPDLAHVGHDH